MVDVQAVLGGTAAVKGHIPQRHLGAILKIEEAGAGAIVAGDRKCARLRPDGMAAAVQSQVLGQRQRVSSFMIVIGDVPDFVVLIRRHSGDFLVSHDVDKSWIIVDECG